MDVTEIRIFLADEERLKAYVTVTFNDCFVVRDLKVINGNGGLFVAMPSKKKKDGTYKDIAHPINSDFRTYLENLILEKYKDELKMVEAGFPIKREDSDQDSFVGDYNSNDGVNPVVANDNATEQKMPTETAK
jgi:stage V sporulation protein G